MTDARQFGTFGPLDDDALAAMLGDLAGSLDLPQTPDVAPIVRARLLREAARRPAMPWWRPRSSVRWALLAALLAVVLLAGVAIGLGFGLPGLRIVFTGPSPTPSITVGPGPTPSPTSTPAPTPSPIPTPGYLPAGAPTTLEGARRAVPFVLLVLPASATGDPTPLVYLDPTVIDGEVVLIYPAGPALPASSTSPVGPSGAHLGLLVTESHSTIERAFLEKMLGPDASIEAVKVRGHDGYWISGHPHSLLVLDANGQAREQTLREVGDVLVWAEGDTLVRIESGLGREATLRLASLDAIGLRCSRRNPIAVAGVGGLSEQARSRTRP